MPKSIGKQAMVKCCMSEKDNLYYSVFRDVIPEFVKIFLFQSIMHLTDQIDFTSMLKEKK
ncbi:hypothetical protein [Leptothoe sp. PORK10 BA2]|uniref:hypothetical protein n=1 Tax=Leptothoe sp. PORK10 BA2 TaxID=3110254 RepID=UPI002B20C6C6|nr:hypothetical protein [Leptothoe sp. PORK10 BA2]